MIDYYELLKLRPKSRTQTIKNACDKFLSKDANFKDNNLSRHDFESEILGTLIYEDNRSDYNKYLNHEHAIPQTSVPWNSYAWYGQHSYYDSGLKVFAKHDPSTTRSHGNSNVYSVENFRDRQNLKPKKSRIFFFLYAAFAGLVLTMLTPIGFFASPGVMIATVVMFTFWFFLRYISHNSLSLGLWLLWFATTNMWTTLMMMRIWDDGYQNYSGWQTLTSTGVVGMAVILVIVKVNMLLERASGSPAARLSLAGVQDDSELLVFDRSERTQIPEGRYFGKPGNFGNAQFKFGYENTYKGETGELYTAYLLNAFSEIQGVKIFHGLKFPGSKNADVDHAILSGNNLIFIDSKQWASGNYYWGEEQVIYGESSERRTRMHYAILKYRDILPEKLNIYTFILIHGKGVVIQEDPDSDGIRLVNTVDGINGIGQLVYDGARSNSTDDDVVQLLIDSLM